MKFFVPLSKVEDAEDGTVRVIGIASTEATDSDNEIIKASAMDAALPEFFRHGTGALREMHQPIAAGTVDEADVGKNGHTTITATVVDPIAILKVRTGVYKGFSVGGKVTGRDPDNRNIITGIRLSEISLVDRPANAEAVMSIYKLENAEADEAETDPEKKQLAVIEPAVGELTVNKVSTGTIEVEPAGAEGDGNLARHGEPVGEAETAEPVQCWHCGIGEHTHVAKADARACLAAQALAKRNRPVDAALEALAKAEAAAGVEPEEKPAEAEAGAEVEKKDYSTDERTAMAGAGEALPDGSFPIKDATDLHNAIQAFGRAKDPTSAKAHIIARAKALGATAELPADWTKLEEAQPLEPPAVDIITLAAQLGDLVKAGARNSAADKTLIQTIHDHSMALGAGCPDSPGEEAAEMAGAKAEHIEDLAKVTAERDTLLTKFADIGQRLEVLTKRLAVVEAQPAMPKYLLHTVDKEQDSGGEDIGKTEVEYMARLDRMSPDERNKELMKLALRVPQRIHG